MQSTLILALLALLPSRQEAQPKKPEDTPGRVVTVRSDPSIPLSIPLSDAAHHFVLTLSFPEPVTRALVPWNEEDISIDTDGADVMVKLLKPVEGDLAFRGRSGTLYRFHLAPATGEGGDRFVKVPPPPALVAAERPGVGKKAEVGAVELVRAMRLGEVPPGVRVSAVEGSVLHEGDAIVMRALFSYDSARHRGYVVELLNRSKDQAFRVDLARFAARDLLLVGARELVVAPGSSTRLYLVFWK